MRIRSQGENKFFKSGDRRPKDGDGEESMMSVDMRKQDFVTTLNSGLTVAVWKMDYNPPINNGFPILIWQTKQGVSITDYAIESNIHIYPNPAKDAINIVLPEKTTQANLTLYNIQGKQLLQQSLNGNNTISVAHLSSGMYIYTILIDGKRMTGKIVKQ
jgi:hypothetical protein